MPAETNRIRQFQLEDAAACSRIVRACVEMDPLTPLQVKEALLHVESPAVMQDRARQFYIAVCMLDATVAGVGGVDLNEIKLLFVAPEHQRQGIGGSLLRHLEAWIPPALFGDIFVYSSAGAVDFYRSHGYQPGGEHRFSLGSCSMATVFMTKRNSNAY
jgi:GNAT superfamily N-acetyltransferase